MHYKNVRLSGGLVVATAVFLRCISISKLGTSHELAALQLKYLVDCKAYAYITENSATV